jgi:hypothetical protein
MLNLRTALLLGGLCFASATHAAPVAAQTTITCQSSNNQFRDCRVPTGGRVRLQQNLSSARCEYGRTWGFDWNSVWVDRGCRGRFLLNGSGSGWESGNWGQRVTCESQSGFFRICNVPTHGYVKLVRQLSQAPCIAGRTWGYQRDQIWVGNGCRGEFELGWGDNNWQGDNRIVNCQSNDGRYSRCFARTEGKVTLRRQLSPQPCVLQRTWGYDLNGVWVDNGCRGEFVVGRGGPGSGWGGYPGTWPGGPGGGSGNVEDRGRQACSSEARIRGYQNVRTGNSDQNNSIVYVYMRGYRSSREYLLSCRYTSSNNRALLTSEDPVSGGGGGGGGNGNIFAEAKNACERKSASQGYQVIGSGPAKQQSWGVKYDLDLRKSGLQYSNAYCNYMSSSRTATVVLGSPDKQGR